MPLVAVLKAIGPKELAMASRGITPPDLGGGMFGARGVPRGYPDPEGKPTAGRGYTPSSSKYHERMMGGADVPAHQMAREEEGREPIPHSGRELSARGGGGLRGAMQRLGVPSRQFFPGTPSEVQGGIAPGMKYGVKTSGIPGRVEAAPHEHRHAELPMADDELDNMAESYTQRGEGNRDALRELAEAFENRIGITSSPRTTMRDKAGAKTSAMADQPTSTGSRRKE